MSNKNNNNVTDSAQVSGRPEPTCSAGLPLKYQGIYEYVKRHGRRVCAGHAMKWRGVGKGSIPDLISRGLVFPKGEYELGKMSHRLAVLLAGAKCHSLDKAKEKLESGELDDVYGFGPSHRAELQGLLQNSYIEE